MKNSVLCIALASTLFLSACGGDQSAASGAPSLLARSLTANVASSASYSGKRASYAIVRTGSGVTVIDNGGADGTITFPSSLKRIYFADTVVAFDIDGVAGQVYRLYKAAFDRQPDLAGLGFHISTIESSGLSLDQVAQNFTDSAEYRQRYGSSNNAQFVTQLYANALHRLPDEGGFAFHLGNLDANTITRAQLLAAFSESPENQSQVLPEIQNGIAYTAYTPIATNTGPAGSIPACPSDISKPFFNTSPVALNDFIAFRPLGFLSPPIHMFPAKHSSFSMTPIGQAAVPKPVVAPGRVYVSEIYEASFSTGAKNYQVFLRPCQEVRAYFGHLASISEKLLAEFNKQAPKCNSFNDGQALVTTCRRENLAVLLEEGEQFATGPDTAGVDFGILDFRRMPAAFIDLAHYDYYYPYYTSPLDYYYTGTRHLIEGKTGDMFGKRLRTALPIGGSYMQDLAGTAQGNWFLPGKYHSNTTDLSVFLSLVHDYVDPAQPLIAMGTSVPGMAMGLYSFTAQATGLINRDFSEIKPDGGIYCFDNFLQGQSAGSLPLGKSNGIVLMSMTGQNALKLEFIAGSACNTVANWTFTAKATSFVR